VAIGIIIALLVAIPGAVILALNRILKEFFLPVVELLRPIPPIAWIPVAILWFGVRGDTGSYFIVFIAAFFPIFINTFTGIQHIEPIHINAAKSLGARRWHLIADIAIPSALPHTITGLRISTGVGWMSLIAAEMVVSYQGTGLGYMFQLNRDVNNPTDVLVNTITIGLIGLLMNWIILRIENKLFVWRQR
jgi:ABC-type nitrate/sulfonate/bicarbonate transport system permease component